HPSYDLPFLFRAVFPVLAQGRCLLKECLLLAASEGMAAIAKSGPVNSMNYEDAPGLSRARPDNPPVFSQRLKHGPFKRRGNCVLQVRRMGCLSRIMALRMTSNCRAAAMMMVLGALPAACMRSRKAASFGMRRMALSVAM